MRDTYQPGKPVVVGLAGEGCTGKTSTAQTLAPPARLMMEGQQHKSVVWEHLAFSMPMYELASIRRKTEGKLKYDRMAYAIHDVLVDLFGYPMYGAPTYKDLVTMVEEVCSYPLNDDDVKPRAFLQWVADSARSLDSTCFVRWMQAKIASRYAYFRQEHPQEVEDDKLVPFAVVISDLRLGNEVDFVRERPNSMVIKLVASLEVRQARAVERDGRTFTAEEASHNTEAWLREAPDDLFDVIIDTSDMTLAQQVDAVRMLVGQLTGEEEVCGPDQPRRLRAIE